MERVNMNELAIIILNYNSAALTRKCVDQLRGFRENYHIIIVDNASTDNSYSELQAYYEHFAIDVIQTGSNGGYSAGNNFGIKYAIEKYAVSYISIMNPDVLITNGEVIPELLSTLKKYAKCAVVGAVAIDGERNYSQKNSAWNIPTPAQFLLNKSSFCQKRELRTSWKIIEDGLVEVDCVAGSFFIIKTEVLKKIGFLDESLFMYNEEILLGYRLKKIDLSEYLRMDLYYQHNHQSTVMTGITQYWKARNRRFKSDMTLVNLIYPNWTVPGLIFIEYTNRVLIVLKLSIMQLFRRIAK